MPLLTTRRHSGVSMHAVRFYFDGEVLRETQTPAEVGMEDGDVIDASVELSAMNSSSTVERFDTPAQVESTGRKYR